MDTSDYLTLKDVDELIAFAQSLIRIKSYSGQEEEVIRFIAQKMFGLGYDEVSIDSMGNLLGRIGARLHVSPKTVDHHVSSVLAKLGAATRVEAARIARERGLLPQDREAKIAK